MTTTSSNTSNISLAVGITLFAFGLSLSLVSAVLAAYSQSTTQDPPKTREQAKISAIGTGTAAAAFFAGSVFACIKGIRQMISRETQPINTPPTNNP